MLQWNARFAVLLVALALVASAAGAWGTGWQW